MEFKDKMSNVAFGGNWSEELTVRHDVDQLLTTLRWAVDNCVEEDVNTGAVRDALAALTDGLIKGEVLAQRFAKGHTIANQSLRKQHFRECLRLIENWLKQN
ncbi:hypothetical protein SAMN04488040_0414 [Sulfitobacter marinus]|uniref:Uncharacterized protein n=1 Tax=Sulfitobacter marinus TaxID=394264 RepID=A0A1I6PZ42_9RHOB|nr:hypothetical protein [Sulfitobacter marinus]SFS45463.1 hypothetical protein SAMN04488040_0414 [Sulfitobacter marinus]